MKPIVLTDRVIIITGGSSGIGKATALVCAKAKMRVVIAARREDELQALAAQIENDGGQALAVVCDVTRDEDVTALITRTVEAFGRLDVMFANAGYGYFSRVLETSAQAQRDIFETNFFGTVRCIEAAVPVMRETSDRGHVLICSSAASEIAVPMYGYYSATKAAQDSIGGALRAELHTQGIMVSTVHPIGTRTGFFDTVRTMSPDAGDGLSTPDAMMQTPEKVAALVLRCLRRPTAEVWPSVVTRFVLALTTAMPTLSAWVIRRMMLNKYENNTET